MKLLTAYVDEHRKTIVKPLLMLLSDELKRSDRDVDGNIDHIQKAASKGTEAMKKAQADVGLSLDECRLLKDAITKDIAMVARLNVPSADSIYGDRVLKAVYSSLKDKGHVLDILMIDDNKVWCLGECKFAIRLFTTRMFSGQLTFYDSIEQKFVNIISVLDADGEIHSNKRTIFVLREHYQQCLRQFKNLSLGDPEYPIAKEDYTLKTIDLVA